MKKRILSLLLCAALLCSLCAGFSAAAAGSHTHRYTQTVTKASVGKSGKIVRTCAVCGKTKTTAIPAVKKIALSKTSYVYSGKAKTPSVTVTDKKGNTLKKGADYTVKYAAGRTASGRYTVKVTLRGNYRGNKTLTFKIMPKAPGRPTAAAVTADSVTLQWTGARTATGYIVYRYDKAKDSYEKLKSTKKTTLTVRGLAPETSYAFAVRAYAKTAKGNLYGAYSKPLTVRTAAKPDPTPAAPTLYYKDVQRILETGVYTAALTFDDTPDARYKLSRRGNDYYLEMEMTENGERYAVDLYYDSTEQILYGKMLGIWVEMDDDEMKSMISDLDLFRLVDLRDPRAVETDKTTWNGKTCTVETVTAQDGTMTTLYFAGGTLVRLGFSSADGDTIWCGVSGFSGKVGTFQKPLHPLKLEF